ncbi:MAG: insulinase family protein [Phycisphaerales bacterium]|nr:insulinase family protein [Phycisphaerales bacterium]
MRLSREQQGVRRGSPFFAMVRSMSLVLVVASITLAQAELPQDPEIVSRELGNGLTVVVKPMPEARDEVSLLLVIRAGTLSETDDQRGAAALLARGATLLPSCQWLIERGYAPDREITSWASYDRTMVGVTLASAGPDAIGRAMDWLADVSRGGAAEAALIAPAQELLSEQQRAHEGVQKRLSRQALPMMAPGSRLQDRAPYDSAEAAAALTPGEARSFADTWYAPRRMTMVIAGDIDPVEMIKIVSHRMGGLADKPVPGDPDPRLATMTDSVAAGMTDQEMSGDYCQVTRLTTVVGPVRDEPSLRNELIERVAMDAFERQLSVRADASDFTILDVQTILAEPVRGVRMAIIAASTPAGYWEQAATLIGQEYARVEQEGLSQEMVRWGAQAVLRRLADASSFDRSADARGAAARLGDEIARGRRLCSDDFVLEFGERMLKDLSADEATAALRRIADVRRSMILATTAGGDAPDEDRVLEVVRKSYIAQRTPLPIEAPVTTILDNLPVRGGVARLEPAPEMPSAASVLLKNGVLVHHAEIRARPGRVAVEVVIAGGRIEESLPTRGRTDAAEVLWLEPASDTRSSDQLEGLLAGRSISLRGDIDDDAIRLSVECGREDLEPALEVIHLLLTEPVIERRAFNRWKHRALIEAERATLSPKGAANQAFVRALAPEGDPRSRPLLPDDIEAIQHRDAQEWVRLRMTTGPIEAAITGDVTRTDTVALASQYFGSLGERIRIDDAPFAAMRHVREPGEFFSDVLVEGPTPHAVVVAGFRPPEMCSPRDEIIMEMAARVLTLRLGKSVRDGSRLASSVHVSSLTRCAFPGYGMFWADSVCDPANAGMIARLIDSSFRDLAQNGPTTEELDAAKRLTLHAIKTRMDDPAWWAHELSQMAYRDRDQRDLLAAQAIVSGMSASELRDGFASAMAAGHPVRLITGPSSGGDKAIADR